MIRIRAAFTMCLVALGVLLTSAAQNPAPGAGTGPGPAAQGRPGSGAPGGGPIGGTLTPKTADERGWGWQVKATMSPETPRPLYNRAKEALLNGRQITSYTISSYDPDFYCEVAKHFDFIWFEMQHSTMSWDEVRRMIGACPRVGAAPFVRMPDAFESSIQKATDLGALGIIVPTVDDALEARDAARYSRYPPFGRRSAGGGQYIQLYAGLNYRQTINDNMLVTVMIETLEGVAMAEEIAATHGVDVIILGNNDLSSFSGWGQNDPRYQDAIIKVHDAALKYGKYYGNAGAQYLTGYTVSPDTRLVQNGPACDGWTPPARGGGGAGRGRAAALPDEEPVVGLPGGGERGGAARGAAPGGAAGVGGARGGVMNPAVLGSAEKCWKQTK
jgi:2-keto-3-deoxy-L-rhamnonate aldolase RhmA